MCHEPVRGCILRIARDELLLILTLEEVEDTGPVPHNFQVGIVHGQLPKSENTTAMINVRCRAKWRRKSRRVAARLEILYDLASLDANALNVSFQVWRRGQ